MNSTTFKHLLESRIEKIRTSLNVKGKEYSTNDDKLHNFKQAAIMNAEHPARSLHGMLTKHLVSYLDMVKGIESGKTYSNEYIDEKITDIINYFILQEAIFLENKIEKLGELK